MNNKLELIAEEGNNKSIEKHINELLDYHFNPEAIKIIEEQEKWRHKQR